MSLKKDNNKLQKYYVDWDKEHYLEYGLNPRGEFILIENFSSWLNKDIKWIVQFTIDKNDFKSLDENNRKYFENLNKDIQLLYKDFRESGFIAGLQMEMNEYSICFFSDGFEQHLQEKKIDYTKHYNTVDDINEKGIQKELERVYATEYHKIHMGISPMGNMIFEEDFSNTEVYLQEPYENEEIDWYVKFSINKSDWNNLDKKTKDLILDYKEKTKKKYENYYNDFPADFQIGYDIKKGFISNEYELTLQKNNIAYTKTLINSKGSVIADML